MRKLKTKKILLLATVLVALFLLEPLLHSESSFAVPLLPSGTVDYSTAEQISLNYEAVPLRQQPRGRAPEPATIFLFAGGVVGMIVRYVRKGFERIKRLMDLGLATFGLAVASPILLFAALIIKLDSRGPVLYRQKRLGKNRKVFTIIKLRTMRLDAEKGTGAVWARKNDPRITSVGRVLRKTRIDEIPQLFNVLRGEMSIVGPRPERPELVHQLKEVIHDYEHRLAVKPGITGLAQVVHKYDENIEDVKKKVKYDLLYIKKMCLLTDLDILARTFGVVVTGKGAN